MLENQPERISKVWLVPLLALMIGACLTMLSVISFNPRIIWRLSPVSEQE